MGRRARMARKGHKLPSNLRNRRGSVPGEVVIYERKVECGIRTAIDKTTGETYAFKIYRNTYEIAWEWNGKIWVYKGEKDVKC